MPDDTGLSRVDNPFREPGRNQLSVGIGALVSIEQQRAIAEVQARMIIARASPRDPIRATDMILQDCTRPTLADSALYQYTRGGSAVSGPSIRLAEAIARRWGNIASGIKEVARHGEYSECLAYAWDLETGYYDERQFQVRHWRDTKTGGYLLKDERDIYELIANMGQRRKRAVLLSVIPGDVVEAATAQCEETLKATADTSPEALKKMTDAFDGVGVTKQQIEARCQCHLAAVRPAQMIQLRKIYASIKDGMSGPEDWFETIPPRPTREQSNAEAPFADERQERIEALADPDPAETGTPPDRKEEPHHPRTQTEAGSPQDSEQEPQHQRRRRRTKAEMAAARAAESSQPRSAAEVINDAAARDTQEFDDSSEQYAVVDPDGEVHEFDAPA